jgi:transposase
LTQRARAYTAPYHEVMRAKIVLLAADGLENTVIADRLDVAVQLVSKWRKRFFEEGLDGLKDRPRTGRPPAFPPVAVVTVKALACELPAETGVPLSRWSAPELAVEAVARGGGVDLGVYGASLAVQRCAQALAAPVVDLSAGSRLRCEGGPSVGPLRRALRRRTPGRERVRGLRG